LNAVTVLDWIILAAAGLMAWRGWARGFVVGALSLGGFIIGAFVGARLAPLVLHQGSESPWAPVLALGGAFVLGGIAAGLLERVGYAMRQSMKLPALGALDGGLGAVLGVCVVLVVVWVAAAVALQTPGLGNLRRQVQESAVLRQLNAILPPSGPLLNALARFDPLPLITGPSTEEIKAPSRASLRQPGARAAYASTVRVLGQACGLSVEGSGWIARDGLVVTNAHVVAGTGDSVTVQRRGRGDKLRAHAVAFDSRNDVALLAVPGLGGRRLHLYGGGENPPADATGAILGYPKDGPFVAVPARVGATVPVLSQDAYGQGQIVRKMTPLRGRVRHGNSGGPVVDGDGRVLTTVFAASTSSKRRGGYGVANTVVHELLDRTATGGRTVSTGGCTS
jgi:uncharacterized membrane protein required for colicin V production